MGVQQDGQRDDSVLSRGELELELASLTLAVTRSAQQRRMHPRSAEPLLTTTVEAFLAASLRLLARTRRAHRGWLIGRLEEIARSAELGIIGFDEWLAAQEAPVRRTADRHAGSVQPTR
jgi:hypothetical protein